MQLRAIAKLCEVHEFLLMCSSIRIAFVLHSYREHEQIACQGLKESAVACRISSGSKSVIIEQWEVGKQLSAPYINWSGPDVHVLSGKPCLFQHLQNLGHRPHAPVISECLAMHLRARVMALSANAI